MLIMRNSTRAALLAIPMAAALSAAPARAGMESDWSAPEGTAVRLLAGASQGKNVSGGIEVRLAPGWKTYWRYPGDSGIPPRFDWSGSENLDRVDVEWPAPARFGDGDGNFSIGYKRDVVLPLRIVPKDATKPVGLRLELDFAVCEKICQPAHARLALDIPAGGAAPSPAALLAAQAAVPNRVPLGGTRPLAVDAAKLEDEAGTAHIRIETRVAEGQEVDLFVEGPDEDWALPLPALKKLKDGRAEFLVPVDGVPKGADVAGTPLRFTLIDGKRAIEVETPLSAP